MVWTANEKRALTWLLALFLSLLTVGCEGDVSFEVESFPESVAGVNGLPDCSKAYEGDEVFVEDLSMKLRCEEGFWEDATKESSKKKSSSSEKQGENNSSSGTSSGGSSSSSRFCDICYTDGGVLEDKRDGTKYKTVIVDGRRWMAENLRYVPDTLQDSVICYKDSAKFCDKYGPMYPNSAKGPEVGVGESWFHARSIPFKGSVCPEGWGVPNREDWKSLLESAHELARDESWEDLDSCPVFWADLDDLSYSFELTRAKHNSTYCITESRWTCNNELEPKHAFIRCIENAPEDPPEIVFDSIVDKRYGDKYKIVKIGSQWWMAENLRFKEDAEQCNPYSDNKYIKDECYYSTNIYGKMLDFGSNLHEDVCPEGWTIPTKIEWYQLFYYVVTHNGDELIYASLLDSAYWKFLPDSLKHSDYNFGMNIRAAGDHAYHPYQGDSSIVFDAGTKARFLTRTQYNETSIINNFYYIETVGFEILENRAPFVYLGGWTERKDPDNETGFSVRCIKDGSGEE